MDRSRRSVLAAAAASLGGVAGCLGGGSDYAGGWDRAETGTEATLWGVAAGVNGNGVAVGEAGTVLTRVEDGTWSPEPDAPGTDGPTLRCAAPTNGHRRAWYAGDDGVVGMYDAAHADFDAHSPQTHSPDFVDVAVDGDAGGETVFLLDRKGRLTVGSMDKQGDVTWEMKRGPGGGTPIAVSFTQDDIGYLCTDAGETLQNVGKGWKQVGIPEVNGGLTDLSGHEESLLDVASRSGDIYRYNGYTWRTISVGDHPISAIDRTGRHGLAVSRDGAIYSLDRKWSLVTDGVEQGLSDAATGTADGPLLCVGGKGYVLEK